MNLLISLLLFLLGIGVIFLKRRLPEEGLEFLGDLRLNLGSFGLLAIGLIMILDYFDLV